MYAGLTISDKPALLDAKARGAEWVAREGNGDLWAYTEKPEKDHVIKFWSSNGKRCFGCDNETMKFVKWSNREPVNIDFALAQIAEMESKPLTWNERINQMTVEEKVLFFAPMLNCTKCKAKQTGVCPFNCRQSLTDFFNSPYTEGENQ